MGLDFLFNLLAIASEREPDWDAAERRIAALEPDYDQNTRDPA